MKSSRHTVGVQLDEKLFALLSRMTDEDGCESISRFIRGLIMKEAASRGFSVEGIEQPKWGLRKDLSSGNPDAIRNAREIAISNLMKSKNSTYLSTAFPNELVSAIKQLSKATGMTVPFLIRSAVVELLRKNGFDVSAIRNPKRRGERTDIVDDIARAKLRKKAAYARSKIRRKRNGEPVDADVELAFKLAYEAMDDQRPQKKNQGEKS